MNGCCEALPGCGALPGSRRPGNPADEMQLDAGQWLIQLLQRATLGDERMTR